MLSAMVADVIAPVFFGSAPFLTQLPAGIELDHIANYLLVALLAAIAGLIGVVFKIVLYKTEDLCDRRGVTVRIGHGLRLAESCSACCCSRCRNCTGSATR